MLVVCCVSFWPPHRSYFAARSAATIERIAAIGLKARNADARGHLQLFEDLARLGIDSPQFVVVPFPRAVPQLTLDPCDAGDETIGLDGAKNRSRLRIDLVNLAFPILTDPERTFRPCESRVSAIAGRGDGSQHFAGRRIDLQNAILAKLK